jgi:hypothetical protein
MKKILKKIIYFLIHLIERIEFREDYWNESNDSLKIQDTIHIDEKVLTDTNYKPVSYIHRTQPYVLWEIKINDRTLVCADNHKVYLDDMTLCYVKDLKVGDFLSTVFPKSMSQVQSIKKLSSRVCLYDLTINDDNHRYYTEGILSHNTICTSIFILWYILFNNNKTIMIVANKNETVLEIVNKIKDIYKYLPFFIKPGVLTWNDSSIKLDTDSRIKSQGKSKTPAIGFTIDILYMDEFAHLDKSIQSSFYENAVPTVSSMKESKVIITSTPSGHDLFFDLICGADLPDNDPGRNQYSLMKVYWYEVIGRDTIWIEPYERLLALHKLTLDEYKEYLINEVKLIPIKEDTFVNHKGETLPRWHFKHDIYNFEDIAPLTIIKWKDQVLTKWSNVTSWKFNEIKTLGGGQNGLEKFGQQYDLRFDKGGKSLFNGEILSFINVNKKPFNYIEIPLLQRKLYFDFNELIWIEDDELFQIEKVKDYYLVISLDFAGGLGKDYTVINIFRVLPMTEEEIKANCTYSTIYDFFRLHQVGIFRSNLNSLQEVADLAYLLFFELFDEEKIKVIIESNTFGNEFLNKMQLTQGGNNEFATHIFARYKHSYNSEFPKPGVIINATTKKMYIKEFKSRLEKNKIRVYEETNIKEIGNFTKHETRAGNEQYKAETGNDDTVMTLVNMCSIFETLDWKNLIEVYMEYGLAGNPITEHSEIKGMEVVDKIDIPTEGTLYKVQDGAC